MHFPQAFVIFADSDVSPIQFYSAIGAVIAALIGGFLSLLSLVSSKDQKISELRNEWISDFRKELSELIAEVRYSTFWVAGFIDDQILIAKDPPLNPYQQEPYKLAYLAFSKAFTGLKLRINPEEPNKTRCALNNSFIEKLDELADTWGQLDWRAVQALTEELRERAVPLLQFEWESIENGNVEHRLLKKLAGVVLIAGLAGVIGIYMNVTHVGAKAPGASSEALSSTVPSSAPSAQPLPK